jgi:hypothetical protein
MMRIAQHAFVVVMMTIALAGCGDDSPNAAPTPPPALPPTSPPPLPPGFAGTWAGTVLHPMAGTGSTRVTIEAGPGAIQSYVGNWQFNFSAAPGQIGGILTLFGSFAGTPNSVSGLFSILPPPSPPDCTLQPSMLVELTVSGTQMTGTVTFGACTTPTPRLIQGVVLLTRQ